MAGIEYRDFAVDVRTSGMNFQQDSLLSIGIVPVDKQSDGFYIELKPSNRLDHYSVDYVRHAAEGLSCLRADAQNPEINPLSKKFDPGAVMRYINAHAQAATRGLDDFYQWTLSKTDGKPSRVIFPSVEQSMFLRHGLVRNVLWDLPFDRLDYLDKLVDNYKTQHPRDETRFTAPSPFGFPSFSLMGAQVVAAEYLKTKHAA